MPSVSRIVIEDLPLLDTLTPDEMTQLYGAGPGRRASLRLETLETREVMAAGISASMAGLTLNVYGTSSSDKISVRQTTSQIIVENAATNKVIKTVNASSVRALNVYAYGGNDIVNLHGVDGNNPVRVDAFVSGAAGNDTIYGGSGNDWLCGGADSDRMYGAAGNDFFSNATSSEYVNGGSGSNFSAERTAIGGTSATDIDQGSSNRCVLLSSMAMAAEAGVDLASRIRYLGNRTFGVKLYDSGTGRWDEVSVYFDGNYVKNSAGKVVDALSTQSDYVDSANGVNIKEFWTVLYQRAYVKKFFNTNPLDGNKVGNLAGDPSTKSRVLACLTGWNTSSIQWRAAGSDNVTMSNGDIARQLQSWLNHNNVVIIGGGAHAYGVASIYYNESAGEWRVRLYNPWHSDELHSAASGISMTSTGENDGFFWVRLRDLRASNQFRHAYTAINPNG